MPQAHALLLAVLLFSPFALAWWRRAGFHPILPAQDELLARARHEMAATIEKAQRDAEGLRSDILARANREAEDKQKKFAEEIERQKRAALEEVRAKTVDLALAAASRLIQTELNDDRQRKLVTSYLDDFRNLPPS